MYYACIIYVNSGEFIYMYVHVNEILNQLKSITVALMKSSLREWFNNTNAISYRKKTILENLNTLNNVIIQCSWYIYLRVKGPDID